MINDASLLGWAYTNPSECPRCPSCDGYINFWSHYLVPKAHGGMHFHTFKVSIDALDLDLHGGWNRRALPIEGPRHSSDASHWQYLSSLKEHWLFRLSKISTTCEYIKIYCTCLSIYLPIYPKLKWAPDVAITWRGHAVWIAFWCDPSMTQTPGKNNALYLIPEIMAAINVWRFHGWTYRPMVLPPPHLMLIYAQAMANGGERMNWLLFGRWAIMSKFEQAISRPSQFYIFVCFSHQLCL